jgi:predicted  nucleic acid-binding Zn-ribbon protein
MEGFRQLIRLHLALQEEREVARRQDGVRAEMKAMEDRVEAARSKLEAANTDAKGLQLEKRGLEGDAGQLEQQRDRYRAQLMQAKTNDIYKTLLHEIETTTAAISVKETAILEHMEAADGITARVAEASRELAEAEAVARKERGHLEDALSTLEAERAAVRSRAAELQKDVPAAILLRYQRIAEARGGKGMALAVGHACSECHVALRPQVWVELVSREEAEQCAGCGRLLYREESLRHGEAQDRPAAGSAG